MTDWEFFLEETKDVDWKNGLIIAGIMIVGGGLIWILFGWVWVLLLFLFLKFLNGA